MKAECILILEFKNEEIVKKVLQSIQQDDQGFVQSSAQGKKLTAVVKSTSVPSLLHTLDDYLACVSVADQLVKK